VLQVLLVHYTKEDKIISRLIWITVLSGSGLTTLGIKISNALKDKGSAVVYLDGDQLQEVFSVDTYTKKNYNKGLCFLLAMKYAHFCRVLSEQHNRCDSYYCNVFYSV
jgi:cytidine diphosphoramidate kinase